VRDDSFIEGLAVRSSGVAILVGVTCMVTSSMTALAASNADSALTTAQHLDVLSFPNSIDARKRPGAETLADYGFTRIEKTNDGVRLIDPSRQWVFGVKIVEDDGGIKVLCIQDEAVSNGRFFSQSTIEVKLGRDGLFHGTGRMPQNDQCPPFHG
jgi:hypothetical protein